MRRLAIAFASIAPLLSAKAYAQLIPNALPPDTMPGHAESPPQSAWERLGIHGIELRLAGGVMLPGGASPVQAPNLYPVAMAGGGDPTGDILRGRESPYGADVLGLDVSVGYRFFRWLSVGAFFRYASFAPQDGTDTGDYSDGTSQLERQFWSLGAYGRTYLTTLHPRLQPWIELGVGYSDDNANYIRGGGTGLNATNGNPETQQFLLEEKGIFVPLTVGLDVRLAPQFSLGPSIGYARVFPLGGCVTVNVDSLSPVPGTSTCKSPPVEANGDGIFSAELFLKITFDPAPSSP